LIDLATCFFLSLSVCVCVC